jgi:hypothetical protein
MALTVEVKYGHYSWAAIVHDEQYPDVAAEFEYEYEPEARFLSRTGVIVRSDPGNPEVTLHEIKRELPLTAWELAARSHVVGAIEADLEEGAEVETPFSDENPPMPFRIAIEYRMHIKNGVTDPVAEIARNHNVRRETARTWVYRARKKGYLGPTAAGKAGASPTGSQRAKKAQATGQAKRRKPRPRASS